MLRFLSLFHTAFDQNGVHEGASLYLFQFFLHGKAHEIVVSRISGTTYPVNATDRELLGVYPEVVQYLLETYAMDDVVMDAHPNVISYRQSSNMTEEDFGDTLWRKAYRCGNVFSENRLTQHFIVGMLPAIMTHVDNHHMDHTNPSYRQLVNYADGYGKTYRTSRRAVNHDARGRATPVRKSSRAYMVESSESSASGCVEDERNILAVCFGSAP